MSKDTVKRVLVATVALAGLVFYAFFFLLVTPNDVDGARGPLHFRLAEDDDEATGRAHLVTLQAWSDSTPQVTATLHHRVGMDGAFTPLRMQRLGSGPTYAAEMPPLPEGQRAFYYVELRDALGNTATVPETAPAAPLPYVRWEGHVATPVLALHISLMIGALFFLVHGLHYSARILSRRDAAQQSALARKVRQAILWGWLCFFVGGIPLGIYVSGTALGWANAWGGWPLGIDITDTKTEVLVVYWGLVLALRPDLARETWRGRASDRSLAWLVVSGAALTAIVYAIPHSFFFQ